MGLVQRNNVERNTPIDVIILRCVNARMDKELAHINKTLKVIPLPFASLDPSCSYFFSSYFTSKPIDVSENTFGTGTYPDSRVKA